MYIYRYAKRRRNITIYYIIIIITENLQVCSLRRSITRVYRRNNIVMRVGDDSQSRSPLVVVRCSYKTVGTRRLIACYDDTTAKTFKYDNGIYRAKTVDQHTAVGCYMDYEICTYLSVCIVCTYL